MQPTGLDIEWLKWGTQQRTAQHSGGIHFYTDDYKFNAVWDKPDDLLATGCTVAIELTFLRGPMCQGPWERQTVDDSKSD